MKNQGEDHQMKNRRKDQKKHQRQRKGMKTFREKTILPIVAVVCFLCILGGFLVQRTTPLQAQEDNRTIRVGMVLNGDESTPYSSNFLQALSRIREKYGAQVQTDVKRNTSASDAMEVLFGLAESGCDLIVSNSYSFEVMAKTAAGQYPKVQFVQACGDNANVAPVFQNYHTFMGRIDEGRFISGQVIGKKLAGMIREGLIRSDEAVVGYVGAYPYAEVISGFTAFYLGVKDQCPDASMKVVYTNTWNDFDKEYAAAKRLIGEGCVAISQHSDTEGPAVACEEAYGAGSTVIHAGYNQNMAEVAPKTSLISTKIDWYEYLDGAVEAVLSGRKIESVVDGQTNGNDAQGGLDRGWVIMLPLNEPVAAEGTTQLMEQSEMNFRAWRSVIFQGNYQGVDPNNPADTIDLNEGYEENATASAPSFHYILDGITVLE